MARDRNVQAFHGRAADYEDGFLGRMHRDVVNRTIEVAMTARSAPARVLDVGCGTGLLLRLMAGRLPDAEQFVGVDPAEAMIAVARERASDPRLRFTPGVAEALPYRDASFDLVVSTTSFDHWRDQQAGLTECARVVRTGGRLVLTDLFSLWLAPTLVAGRRGRARTKRRAGTLLAESGFRHVKWRSTYALILRTAVATTDLAG